MPADTRGSNPFYELTAKAADARDEGDTSDAIKLYEAVPQLDPKWPDGWWYVGSMQYEMNAYGPASDALTHYIDLTPGAGPAYALRGLCEFEESKDSESLEVLQREISLGAANQPKNAAVILYHDGLLLTKLGRLQEALGQFTTMVKHGTLYEDIISPSSTITHAMLAWAYGLRGDYPQALPDAQKAVAEDPSLSLAHLVLGRSMIETGEAANGVPHLQMVLAEEPQNLEAHLALAEAYSKLGKVTDARRERLVRLGISGQGTPNASM